MFETKDIKYAIVTGESYFVEKFKKEHPTFQYAENADNIEKDGILWIVAGNTWKSEALNLESRGYVFWKDIFPDWAEKLVHDEQYFYFEEVKKYVGGGIKEIADIFEYLAKYKKIAMVYGNCQSLYLSALLQKSKTISKEYICCRMTWVQKNVDERETGFDRRYMSKVDLFIYQIVSKENVFGEKLSTDEILPLLKEEAIKVSVPFTYFKGYFPQYIKNRRNDDVRRGEGHVPYGDAKIQEFLETGNSVKETTKLLKSLELYSKEECCKNYMVTMQELKNREEKCDIKISDFIEENYQSHYLFYSPSHPTNYCLAEVVNRVLRYLGYEEIVRYDDVIKNNRYELQIYPSVRKHLKLTFEKEKFAIYREGKRDEKEDESELEKYVEKYAECCFPELNEQIRKDFRSIDIKHMIKLNNSIAKERRNGVVEISGKTVHLALYLTIECDNPNGMLFSINPNYAPARSYIFPVTKVLTGGVVPCTIYANGETFLKGNLKKGQVVIVDTTWIKK